MEVWFEAAGAGDVATIRVLAQDGADPNADEHGWTAIMWAANNGHLDLICALSELGANPEVADQGGFTAMMKAAREGRLDAVRALLGVGADPNGTDDFGGTARDWAQDAGNSHITAYLERCAGWRPIHLACAHRRPVSSGNPATKRALQ